MLPNRRVLSFPSDEATALGVDATYKYYAFAPCGTAMSAASWKIYREPLVGPSSGAVAANRQYANGNANYTNVANNMLSLSYS